MLGERKFCCFEYFRLVQVFFINQLFRSLKTSAVRSIWERRQLCWVLDAPCEVFGLLLIVLGRRVLFIVDS